MEYVITLKIAAESLHNFVFNMARPNQEAIETFMSITGTSEEVAARKLEDHGGDLNEAVNAHFSEGDRNIAQERSLAAPQDDFMAIDDPTQVETHVPPSSLLSAARTLNPFSLLDPTFRRNLFDDNPNFSSRASFVSHPREVREIPIEVKDSNERSDRVGLGPTIEDVTETSQSHGPEIRGTVIIDNEEDEDISTAPIRQNDILGGSSRDRHITPTAPEFDTLPDSSNDIEEEMVRAAIEASKQEAEGGYPNQQFGVQNDTVDTGPRLGPSPLDDHELAHAVSLSLKTAEQEKQLREQVGKVGGLEFGAYSQAAVEEPGHLPTSNGWRQRVGFSEKGISNQSKLETGSSSIQGEGEEAEEQPLVRHRSRRSPSSSVESIKEVEEVEVISPPSSPGHHQISDHPQLNGNSFTSDEWGGISSEEHDEAVMLEAALFGGIPENNRYHYGYGPHQFMRSRRIPRPPSPGLAAQRLIREQQDDEYLASLQADREKELRAMEEAEARRLEEQAAREAALEEVRLKEEEARRKLEEEQEFERHLAAKEASLPLEPASDDENAVNLLVRMPDGSRHGRRFRKSDKLQSLFDFMDVGRRVKPGTYRLVRPYPRRAFSDGESVLTLNELGLTSKQEALFLELI